MRKLNVDKLQENVARVAQYDLDERLTFGSAYAVCQDGQLVLEQCFGTTAPEGGEAVRPDTLFRLASMTKPIVTVAALMMIDRGLLSLDAPVGEMLPRLANIRIVTPDGVDRGVSPTALTVRHMLTHTSGLGGLKPRCMTDADKATAAATIDYFVREGLDFEPFTKQAYNSFVAFDVINELIKLLVGMDAEAFLQRELLAPCGMVDTTFLPSERQWERVIAMHDRKDGRCVVGHTWEACVFEDFPAAHLLGGAGMISSLSDYVRFAEMLLAEGQSMGGRVLSAELVRQMSMPQVPYAIMQQSERWGLGVRVITDERYRLIPVGCYGWSGAYGSHFWVDPKTASRPCL